MPCGDIARLKQRISRLETIIEERIAKGENFPIGGYAAADSHLRRCERNLEKKIRKLQRELLTLRGTK